jgi:mannose-6-phosphate isomerase
MEGICWARPARLKACSDIVLLSMPKLDIPLHLSPVFKPKIWGQSNLEPFFTRPVGKRGDPPSRLGHSDSPIGANDPIGEVWITDEASRFLNGPCAGLMLKEASETYGTELHGGAWPDTRFPLLAKYIYTRDWLSVQVHPDDDYARVHDPGNFGKCEMWYFLSSDDSGEVLLALKAGVTKEVLAHAFADGTSRNLIQPFHPETDEGAFVPPGTVHALGPGLVLFEVEENSDLTYRLDDFGRLGLDGKPRPLHWRKGLEVTRAELPQYRNLPRLEFQEPYGSRRWVLACRYFALEVLVLSKIASFTGSPERVETLSILGGEGRVETEAGWMAYRTGDTWVIPPGVRNYRLAPEERSRLLKFYVPDIERDFRSPLAERGVSFEQIDRIIFAQE